MEILQLEFNTEKEKELRSKTRINRFDLDLFINIIPLFEARKLTAFKVNYCDKLESIWLI